MKTVIVLLTLYGQLLLSFPASGQEKKALSTTVTAENYSRGPLVSANPPYTEEDKILQEINYLSPARPTVTVNIACSQLQGSDSILLYSVAFQNVPMGNEVSTLELDLSNCEHKKYWNVSFFEAFKKIGTLPPGSYRTVVSVISDTTFRSDFLWEIDSTLSHRNDLRTRINSVFENKKSKLSLYKDARLKKHKDKPLAKTDLEKSTKKLNKNLRKLKGVRAVPLISQNKTYNELYYENWFLGRYEIVAGRAMKDRIAGEEAVLSNNVASLVDNDLTDFTGVTSQMKRLGKKNKCDQETTGNLTFTTTLGNGQEPGSEQDNNYQEVLAQIGTTVLDIPIVFETYFTTQDFNRSVKGSYIRAHYDAESVKSDLVKLIDGYRNKFLETTAKSKGLENLYSVYIDNLKQEQNNLLSELNAEYGISRDVPKTGSFDRVLNEQMDNADTSEKARKAKEKLNGNKDKAKTKYDKILANQQKIDKYSKLVEQYRNKLFFDSAITTNELNKLQGDDISYKELARSSKHLLPTGKASSFLSGLTKLEVGMLNQYESNYTMNGQALKGGNIGYDFGHLRASASIGKTEYISRDGTLDRYNSLLGRVDIEPLKDQKVGLLYYIYAPTRAIFQGTNFIKQDISIPNLLVPIHILSFTYNGNLTKDLYVEAESAVSERQHLNVNKVGLNNNASKVAFEYNIPLATASVRGEYEHMGQDFENTSLPFIKSASERYTLSTRIDLFRSLFTIGVQYTFLKQLAFNSTGYSKKAGFDVKTNFKQYPNIQLSYKPFSTFRSYSDTLAVAQRPMFGEVWIARATYQIKRLGQSHRFNLLYNQNSSNIDTTAYKSTTIQAGYIFLSGPNSVNGTIGWMKSPLSDSTGSLGSEATYFITGSVSHQINKEFTVMLGQELGFAHYGLQRYSTVGGGEYRPERIPVSFRLMLRYSNLRLPHTGSTKNLLAGQVGINWTFKMKKRCDNI